MLKTTFRAVNYISGAITKRSTFASVVRSNVRPVATTRTLFDKEDMRDLHKPRKLEKYVLVIAGCYKKPSDVPEKVSFQQLKRAYDLARGRTMIAMVFFWSVLLYVAIVTGRTMREAGVNLEEIGTQRIAALREKGILEQEAMMKASQK